MGTADPGRNRIAPLDRMDWGQDEDLQSKFI